MGCKHRLRPQLSGQCHHLLAANAVTHDQATAWQGGVLAQVCVELAQGFADELYPPVYTRQCFEDVAVKDKQAMHLAAGLQCPAQGGVVGQPKVAPEPHQTGVNSLGHVRR